MKYPLLTLCFAALALFGSAQDAPTEHHRHEIGLNCTPLLRGIFNVTSNVSDQDLFNLSYKFLTAENRAIRSHIGVAYASSVDESASEFRFSQWNTGLNLAAGYEWRFTNTGRWVPFLGLDVVHDRTSIRTENVSSFDTTTTDNKTVRTGGAGVVGCQFVVNKRLRLATEASLRVSGRWETTDFTSQQFPETNSGSYVTGLDIETIVPLSLFLYITL